MRITYPAAAAALLIGVSAQPALATTVTFTNTGNLTIGATSYGTATPLVAPANTVAAQQSTIKYSTTSGVSSYFGNYARATSSIVYDPVANTYTIRDTGSLTTKSTFGPTGTTSGNFTIYTKSPTETFRVLNKSAVSLTYVDFGEWKRSSTAGGTTSSNDTYLVWGSKTPKGALTGSATYSTIYDGSFIDKNGAHALDGTGGITANFGSGTLSYTAAINGVPVGPLAFAGNGVISSRTQSFTTSNSTSGYTLSQYGDFYGPHGEEVGGLFHLSGGTKGNGQGAFAGHQ